MELLTSTIIMLPVVASAYRQLLRAAKTAFEADTTNYAHARVEARSHFLKNSAVADPAKIEALAKEAVDAADFLLYNVVQGVKNDRGNYVMKPKARHTKASNE
uniref:Complex 1 LYR protein domain-containing protein n=1 Tax=Palpitomonas bilix TaxID=652834 RepID=A0A7S3G1F3_9EUKA